MAALSPLLRRPWLYWGCSRDVGHYLFDETLAPARDPSGRHPHPLAQFDGTLCEFGAQPYVASLTRLGALGYSALAFWDRSLDTRVGSNSIFFAPSLRIAPMEILRGAEIHFPSIVQRVPLIDIAAATRQHDDEGSLLMPDELRAVLGATL